MKDSLSSPFFFFFQMVVQWQPVIYLFIFFLSRKSRHPVSVNKIWKLGTGFSNLIPLFPPSYFSLASKLGKSPATLEREFSKTVETSYL